MSVQVSLLNGTPCSRESGKREYQGITGNWSKSYKPPFIKTTLYTRTVTVEPIYPKVSLPLLNLAGLRLLRANDLVAVEDALGVKGQLDLFVKKGWLALHLRRRTWKAWSSG